jgi:cell division cycle 20-like protein 1 (cofactor of APC complex)
MNDKSIKVWNINKETSLRTFRTESQVCSLAFCGHSNQFVSTHGYPGNEVVVWNFVKKEVIAKLEGHTERVLQLAVEPDGQDIVTGAADETLRFWTVFPKISEQSCYSKGSESLEKMTIDYR